MKRFSITSQRVALPCGSDPDRLEVCAARIVVEGHRVLSVSRDSHPATDEETEAYDFGDHLVTPAFINAHTHLALVGLRGSVGSEVARGNMVEELFYGWERRLTADDIRALARMGAYECLLSGTGMVWDHYFHADALVGALRDTGLGGVVCPTLQDRSGPGVPQWEEQLDATVRLANDPSLTPDAIGVGLGPHATDTVSAELWQRCVELARAHGLPIHAHCAQSLEEFERRYDEDGCSPVEWLQRLGVLDQAPSLLLVHMLYVSRHDLERLAPDRHRLGLCPYSQMAFAFPAPVHLWHAMGLRWITATDAAASNDSMSLQKELRWIGGSRNAAIASSGAFDAFARSGSMDRARELWALRGQRHDAGAQIAHPQRLMASVWAEPGRLHPRMKAGAIAPGQLANLVVWDTDHPSMWPTTDPLRALAYNDTGAAIEAMWVAGRPIGQRGSFAQSIRESDSYREARQEADERLRALRV